MRTVFVLALAVFAAGCKPDAPAEMPLTPGMTWTYSVRTPYYTYVEPLTVKAESPVGKTKGAELQGPMGRSRLGWEGSRLVAATLGHTQFEPPLPLLDVAKPEGTWSGLMIVSGKSAKATATLKMDREQLRTAARTFSTIRSTLTVKSGERSMELISWFSPGVGLVRQEQRNEGSLALHMEWIRGPGNSNERK